jgi:hypothetical protein
MAEKDIMNNPWTQIERDAPDLDPVEAASGHPTRPGFNDDPGDPQMGGESPGNGSPGVPLVLPGKRGTGIGGGFGGPIQPGVTRVGEED